MSRATARFFKHNDMDHLERILKENRANYNGCLIITEGAFSMDGTIGRLDEIHRLSRKYNARYFVDQAHCIGVVGKRGLGAVEKFDLKQETDIIMGLFSKAWGSVGGFVVGSRDLCDWLRVFSRSYLFATSLPPSTCAATLASIRLMEETDLVVKLQSNIQLFRSGLRSLGADFQESHESAIFPVEIKNEQKMGRMFQSFLDDGIYVLPVVYPVVGRNRCRFRFSIRADHSISDLDFALNSLEKAMMKADITFAQIAEMGSAAGSSRADTPIRAATKVAGLDRS
jgi:glycine C-acetyltransferase